MPSNFQNPKAILCFNPFKRLMGVFSSYREVEKLTGFKHQCILRADNGDTVSAYGHYWRELDAETILESDDLGSLNLADYDLGVIQKDRLVYKTAEMGRGKETVMISKIANKLRG